MKRSILIIFAISLLVTVSYSTSEAVYIAESPFTSSFVEVIPNFDGFGNTALITYESTDYLGSLFVFLIDPFGVPVATSSTSWWVYLFADVLSDGSVAVYGSNTGFNNDWTRIF